MIPDYALQLPEKSNFFELLLGKLAGCIIRDDNPLLPDVLMQRHPALFHGVIPVH